MNHKQNVCLHQDKTKKLIIHILNRYFCTKSLTIFFINHRQILCLKLIKSHLNKNEITLLKVLIQAICNPSDDTKLQTLADFKCVHFTYIFLF